MTDRTVSVKLRAEVSGYVASMGQAAAATKGVAVEASKAAAANKQASQGIGRASLVGGAALAGLAVAAVKMNADFDKAMSGVKAATHETAGNMNLLRAAAVKAGADTAFSAMEAADGITALAKAGVQTKDVLSGGLRGALDLAAAGQVSVGDAAETAATALTQFNLKGKDIPHVADLLAAAAGKAQGGVADMSMALKQGGLVAAQMGLSIEDTTATLAAFAAQGLIGSDAGTSLKTMLLKLANPSKEAAATMSDLGIQAYDLQGNFVGVQNLAGQLQTAFAGQTQATRDAALATIFGSDAIRGANVLYKQGASGIADWTNSVNDQGYAAKTAAIQLDNLRGDLEKLGGSIQTALIESGGGGNSVARHVTQQVTSMVEAYSALPGPAKTAVTAVSAVGGAVALASGGFLLAAPRIAETRKALDTLRKDAPRTTGAMTAMAGVVGKLSIAFAAAATIDSFFGPAASELQFLGDKITASAGPDKQAQIEALTAKMKQLRDEAGGLDLGVTTLHWTSGQAAKGDEADALAARIAALKHEMELEGIAAGQAGMSTAGLASDIETVSPAAEDAAKALQDYSDALTDMSNIDAYTSAAELKKSFHDLHKELKDGGKVTNDEKIALGGFARQANEASNAVLEQSGSQEKASATAAKGRRHFEKLAIAAGYGADEAHALAVELVNLPARTDVKIDADTSPAMAALHALVAAILASHPTITVAVAQGNASKAGRIPTHNASGGFISGPGTGTSDSIPAYLSNGEYVVRAAAVRSFGAHNLDRINAQGFAAGGKVDKPSKSEREAAAKKKDDAKQDRNAAASATATAGKVSKIADNKGNDTVAELTAAIAAVERLTAAYEEQQAVAGMSAAERRKYHAEQKMAAASERLTAKHDAAVERKDNKAAWDFDHMNTEDQIKELDRRLAGEKKYSDKWVADAKLREQLIADQAAQQKAADDAALAAIQSQLEAAIQERDQKIESVKAIFASFGSIGNGVNVPGANGEITGAQVGGTDVLSGSLIASSMAAKVQAAKAFIANLRALQAAGLNGASLSEILNMGPVEGGAYAAALAADTSVIASINSSQAEISSMASTFGTEYAGNARYVVGSGSAGPAVFNIVDANGVLLGTMYGAAEQVAGQIANNVAYGRAG